MGNEVTMFNGAQLPAFARNRTEVSPLAKALAGRGEFGKRLSIKGSVFRLIAGGKEVSRIDERYLDVIIVAAAEKIGRTWYAKKYAPEDSASAPNCWSPDGDTPDKSVKLPQSPNCASCAKNAKGSGEGDSRACRYSQRIAVVLQNDPEGDVLQLSLPATSLFGKAEGDNRPLQEYARWLAAQTVSPEEVVTRLKFDTTAENPKLFFKAMRWLTDDEHATAVKQGKTEDAKNAVTMTVAQADGVHQEAPVDALPPKGAKPLGPALTDPDEGNPPGPAADDDGEAPPPPPAAPKRAARTKKTEVAPDAPEPAVRKAADAGAAVPPRAGLAATIANWEEE